jgi:formate dehydrogenase major subunit
VQVMPVTQPSEWQREYQRFNQKQLELAKLETTDN